MPIHNDIIMWMALFNEEQLRVYGGRLGRRLGPGSVIALVGGLGAGKTTLTKAIAAGLGVREVVTSPTFTLVNEYLSGRLPLYHFDLYRLAGPEAGSVYKELAEIGYEEYFYGDGVTVIEWADRIEGLLPEYAMRIDLSYTGDPNIRQVEERLPQGSGAAAAGDGDHHGLAGAPFFSPWLGAGNFQPGAAFKSHGLEKEWSAICDGISRVAERSGARRPTLAGNPAGSILAVETTGPLCSVALRTEDGRVFYRVSGEGLMHLTSLLPMIEGLLGEAGVAPEGLGCIAVSAGPGSFTGIRIGVATVRALAQTLDIPVIKVPTLETFVYLKGQGSEEGHDAYIVACPVFDARRDQIYAGAYMLEADGRIMTLVQGGAYGSGEYFAALGASVEALAVLTKRISGSDGGIVCRFMGDGVSVCFPDGEWGEKELPALSCMGDGVSVCFPDGEWGDGGCGQKGPSPLSSGVVQDARAVLKWAEAHGVLVGYDELEPVYMRKAEAQRRLDERNNKAQEPFPFVLREATEDDAYGISVIERLSFGEPWLEESILGDIRLEYSDYVVCESEGLILGYAGLHRILEEGHITNIAVHPGARRKGIGAAVLKELVKRAELWGTMDFTLEVRDGDEAAIRFYEDQGFVSEGVRTGYYPKDGGRREDARIMWRRGAPADV